MELRDVNLVDRDQYVAAVPHETFELLRREAPVYWHAIDEVGGSGFWAVTRHKDVVEVNRDNLQWSSHQKTALMMESDPDQLAQQQMMMLNMDPPMHTRYRLLVNKGFTPRHVNALEENIRRLTNEIIDEVAEKGSSDFVVDMAAELPLQVIAEVMGVPQEDRHKVFDWSNRMIGSEDPEYAVSPEHVMEASMELYAYANALAAQKRAKPGEDIMSALLNAEVDGERLTELEFDLFFLLLAVAGNETTRNLISHAMLALIENPGERKKLVDDPSLIPAAVEEMLRWGTPVMQFRRTATADTVLGGQEIKEGDKVVIWYISANRDETMFTNPYSFDVTRTPNEHVAFGGGGPHFCLGANLARMEIRVMFQEVLRRLPQMELAGPVERLRSNFINGIKHMPVEFAPSGRET
ncbi:MAG: cytochrome [Acidimicrobiales bacterium]|jgi:cholest-4-en-3-one 26-monooxygenase|nr:cytochrome [Acidimicrobiales bacterium]